MSCDRVTGIMASLLSPAFAPFLREYVERQKSDPQFLMFHANSTILKLRVQLDLQPDMMKPCADCPINALAKCDILEALGEAIRIRGGEEGDIAA